MFSGKVTTSGKTVLGDGTKFTTQLQIGWSLVLKGMINITYVMSNAYKYAN